LLAVFGACAGPGVREPEISRIAPLQHGGIALSGARALGLSADIARAGVRDPSPTESPAKAPIDDHAAMQTDEQLVPRTTAPDPIDPRVRIGHAHLRTADIDHIRHFYVDVLGFDVTAESRDVPGWGTTGDVLFVSAGGYHHHLGFNTWKSRNGEPMPDGYTGLHHIAIAYPTRQALADAYRRLKANDWPIRQTESYSTHDAIYVIDPDGNTLELMWDKPPEQWKRDGAGHWTETAGQPLDLEELLASLGRT
jgi:catechol 2,3-dioxygenase